MSPNLGLNKERIKKMVSKMSKNTKPDIFLILCREDFNSLVSVLSFFEAADETAEDYYKRNSIRLKSKILKYAAKLPKEAQVSVKFFGTEAAVLIKIISLYLGILEKPRADYFNFIEKKEK